MDRTTSQLFPANLRPRLTNQLGSVRLGYDFPSTRRRLENMIKTAHRCAGVALPPCLRHVFASRHRAKSPLGEMVEIDICWACSRRLSHFIFPHLMQSEDFLTHFFQQLVCTSIAFC